MPITLPRLLSKLSQEHHILDLLLPAMDCYIESPQNHCGDIRKRKLFSFWKQLFANVLQNRFSYKLGKFHRKTPVLGSSTRKETPTQVFSCALCQIFKNTFLYKTLPEAGSVVFMILHFMLSFLAGSVVFMILYLMFSFLAGSVVFIIFHFMLSFLRDFGTLCMNHL